MSCRSAILFGTIMAIVDVIVLSMLKMRYTGQLKGNWVFVVCFLVYGFQSVIFYKSLSFSNMTIMNIMWDVISDVLVTIVGLYYFKEVTDWKQKLGIVLAIVSIILLK